MRRAALVNAALYRAAAQAALHYGDQGAGVGGDRGNEAGALAGNPQRPAGLVLFGIGRAAGINETSNVHLKFGPEPRPTCNGDLHRSPTRQPPNPLQGK